MICSSHQLKLKRCSFSSDCFTNIIQQEKVMGYHLRGVTTTIFLVTWVNFNEILFKGKKLSLS